MDTQRCARQQWIILQHHRKPKFPYQRQRTFHWPRRRKCPVPVNLSLSWSNPCPPGRRLPYLTLPPWILYTVEKSRNSKRALRHLWIPKGPMGSSLLTNKRGELKTIFSCSIPPEFAIGACSYGVPLQNTNVTFRWNIGAQITVQPSIGSLHLLRIKW